MRRKRGEWSLAFWKPSKKRLRERLAQSHKPQNRNSQTSLLLANPGTAARTRAGRDRPRSPFLSHNSSNSSNPNSTSSGKGEELNQSHPLQVA